MRRSSSCYVLACVLSLGLYILGPALSPEGKAKAENKTSIKATNGTFDEIKAKSITVGEPGCKSHVTINATNGYAGVWVQNEKGGPAVSLYVTPDQGAVVGVTQDGLQGGAKVNGYNIALSVNKEGVPMLQVIGKNKVRCGISLEELVNGKPRE